MKRKSVLLAAFAFTTFLLVLGTEYRTYVQRLKNIDSSGAVGVEDKIIKINDDGASKFINLAKDHETSIVQQEHSDAKKLSGNLYQQQSEHVLSTDNKNIQDSLNVDPINVAVLNADEIEVIYNFSQLQANADNSLKLNEDTVTVLAGLFNTQSYRDIQPHLTKIQSAAAIDLPIQASQEFTELVERYGLFHQKILFDDTAFTSPTIDMSSSLSMAEKLIAYQDAYLGKQTAEKLFYLERAHFKLYGQLEERYGKKIPDYALESMHVELSKLVKEHNAQTQSMR